jgi:single-strand DNA-binding protein
MSGSKADAGSHNEVRLVGRVTPEPSQRELPSGTTVTSFRIVVARNGTTPMTTGSRQTTDWVDCAVWGGRVRRTCTAWRVGDTVEVEGALRRRFLRPSATGAAATTRMEVEVLSGRRLERAT